MGKFFKKVQSLPSKPTALILCSSGVWGTLSSALEKSMKTAQGFDRRRRA